MSEDSQAERRYPQTGSDERTPFERDRDRILYSDAFARLNAVTQVASAGELHVFHNRLTHSLKVAQVGRRMTEAFLRRDPQLKEILSADVVEAACLAHDLGHPPFGHIGESCLNRLVAPKLGGLDGFEGNAQSFRIVTHLERRQKDRGGLNLTRATLNAILKYPWIRRHDMYEGKKWCVYAEQKSDFDWVRNEDDGTQQSLEAQIMDWADEITYAAHDLQDFLLVGKIPPLEYLVRYPDEYLARCEADDALEAGKAALGVLDWAPLKGDRVSLKNLNSVLVSRYVGEAKIEEGKLDVPEPIKLEVSGLTQFTKQYVIRDPSLATQQAGQERVLEFLFECFLTALEKGNPLLLPSQIRDFAGEAKDDTSRARLAVDAVAGLTEAQAVRFYQRLSGHDGGSILDSYFALS